MSNEITLKDVETAIKVLAIFATKMREAERLARRMGLVGRAGHLDWTKPEAIMSQLMANALAGKTPKEMIREPEEEEIELTEEELKRMREIAERVKTEKTTV
jgi:flagellar motor component MotA